MPPASSETHASTLIGDRLCLKCGYNLIGQPIFREEHYDLLIVRCPECATVASLQEYPLLGRWANRWAALLAGLWLLVMVALWVASAAALFGFAVGAAEIASERYGLALYEQFNVWQIQQNAGVPRSAQRAQMVRMNDFTSWWQQQDSAALLRGAGGLWGGVNAFAWYVWGWEAVIAFVLGVVWATLLIARRRFGLLICVPVVLTGAALLSVIVLSKWLEEPMWWYQASNRQVGPTIMGLSLAWGGICLSLGLLTGRAVARGMVRLMLPPQLRSALAFLWLADGLAPPKANAQTLKR